MIRRPSCSKLRRVASGLAAGVLVVEPVGTPDDRPAQARGTREGSTRSLIHYILSRATFLASRTIDDIDNVE